MAFWKLLCCLCLWPEFSVAPVGWWVFAIWLVQIQCILHVTLRFIGQVLLFENFMKSTIVRSRNIFFQIVYFISIYQHWTFSRNGSQIHRLKANWTCIIFETWFVHSNGGKKEKCIKCLFKSKIIQQLEWRKFCQINQLNYYEK